MYKLLGQNTVKRLADGACIPFADGNRDYESYKLWLADGNTPEPEFTEEELAQQATAKEKAEAQAYLDSTDWIAIKYNDVVTVTGTMTKAEFLSKYKEIYDKRAEARAKL